MLLVKRVDPTCWELSAPIAITAVYVHVNAILLGAMEWPIKGGSEMHGQPSPTRHFISRGQWNGIFCQNSYSIFTPPKWNGTSGRTQEFLRTLAKCPIPFSPSIRTAYWGRSSIPAVPIWSLSARLQVKAYLFDCRQGCCIVAAAFDGYLSVWWLYF